MARYDYIPHGYKVIGEYLVNIENGKVWNSDKTIEEIENKTAKKVISSEPAVTETETVSETVIVPAVSANKTRKKINKG